MVRNAARPNHQPDPLARVARPNGAPAADRHGPVVSQTSPDNQCNAARQALSVPLGVYVHIPFCRAKCAYCDFNSFADLDALYRPYVEALLLELRLRAEQLSHPAVDTIYIGGGTPTVLPASELDRILASCHQELAVTPNLEVTVEANPGTLSHQKLRTLRHAGVNRLSLGAQSFSDDNLRMLGRIHTSDQISTAIAMARSAGLTNVSLDLIYGLPNQTLTAWSLDLDRALALRPQHLSLYALSVEDGTPLAQRISARQLPSPDPDLAADMYALAEECLQASGYVHYELSNWALPAPDQAHGYVPGFACRHNLKYWRVEPYLGLGAGAHSCLKNHRCANVGHPRDYIGRLNAGISPVDLDQEIGSQEWMAETMILGLRLMEGVRFADFHHRHGQAMHSQYGAELAELQGLALLDADESHVFLTARGRLLANQVFVRFWRT